MNKNMTLLAGIIIGVLAVLSFTQWLPQNKPMIQPALCAIEIRESSSFALKLNAFQENVRGFFQRLGRSQKKAKMTD